MKVPKNYHSSMVNEKEISKELSFYRKGKSCVFNHNIFDGVHENFMFCDAIYSEPAWKYGYDLFNKRCGNIFYKSYNEYIDANVHIIKSLDKPSFIVMGKHALKRYSPDLFINIDFMGYKSILGIWNYKKIEVSNNIDAIDFVSSNFDTILDFNCGYGNTISDKTKNFIMSDMNKKCIYYIAKTKLQYED